MIDRLQAQGAHVTAPANPLRGVAADSAYIDGVFEQTPGRVVAVGHSYGGADAPAAILLHGWPYDIHSYAEVTPRLAVAGYRAIVPYLRGYRRRGSCLRRPCATGSRLRSRSTPSP